MSVLINIYQQLLIIGAATIVVAFLVVFILISINNDRKRRNLPRYYYPVVRKTALYLDLYLMNVLKVQIDSSQTITFDHVIFGDKYIYCILDLYAKGSISGNREDREWLITNSKTNNVKKITNPLLDNNYKISKLGLKTGLEKAFFINVILVNNDLDISSIKNTNDEFIISRKDFYRLIGAVESRDVATFNAGQLAAVVSDIDKQNTRKTRRNKSG